MKLSLLSPMVTRASIACSSIPGTRFSRTNTSPTYT
uniref:Uncharacterized protein n=1 Tax=Anguilla anguilla TaxID=7936 RepID=A0A0E9PCP2_ANGAN